MIEGQISWDYPDLVNIQVIKAFPFALLTKAPTYLQAFLDFPHVVVFSPNINHGA